MPADANRSSATGLAPAETVFFGREAELGHLIGLLREATESRGAFVFVTGATGSGVSSLLGQLPDAAAADERTSRVGFGIAACDPYTPFDPFQPFVGILNNTHPGAVHFELEDGDGRPQPVEHASGTACSAGRTPPLGHHLLG